MNKPLFDEDINDDSEVLETEVVRVNPLKHDKIFQNDYNTGNLEFEEYGPPKVDQDFIDDHMEAYYDSSNYYEKMKNMEKVDDYFKQSEIGQLLGLKKKVPKQLIPRLYISMKGCFESNELSESEFFTIIAEYFGMSYDVFYANIPAIYRECLVRELDNKYGILKKRGQRKLF